MEPIEAGPWPPGVNSARQFLAAVVARTDVDDLLTAQVLVIASELEAEQPTPSPITPGPASSDLHGDLGRASDLLTDAAFASETLYDSLLFVQVAGDIRKLIEQLPTGPTSP